MAEGSKVILLGDPDQVDNMFLGRRIQRSGTHGTTDEGHGYYRSSEASNRCALGVVGSGRGPIVI